MSDGHATGRPDPRECVGAEAFNDAQRKSPALVAIMVFQGGAAGVAENMGCYRRVRLRGSLDRDAEVAPAAGVTDRWMNPPKCSACKRPAPLQTFDRTTGYRG
jgi:hypothetical protein